MNVILKFWCRMDRMGRSSKIRLNILKRDRFRPGGHPKQPYCTQNQDEEETSIKREDRAKWRWIISWHIIRLTFWIRERSLKVRIFLSFVDRTTHQPEVTSVHVLGVGPEAVVMQASLKKLAWWRWNSTSRYHCGHVHNHLNQRVS